MLCAVCECCMQVEVCSLYSSEVSHVTVNVCVLATSANVTEHELQQQRHLLGTAAVIFVISLSDADLLSMQVSLVIVTQQLIKHIRDKKHGTKCGINNNNNTLFSSSISACGFVIIIIRRIINMLT